MSVEIIGMKELLNRLEKMEDGSKKAINPALREGGKIIKRKEVEVVKREHSKYSENVGYKEIKAFPIRTRKKSGASIDIGIKGRVSKATKRKDRENVQAKRPRPTYWDRIRGIYFNNYGFYHNRTGNYVAGSNWLGKAYDEGSDEAYLKVKKTMLEKMGLD